MVEKEKSKRGAAAFLQRVTFIANIFFAACLVIRYTESALTQSLTGIIIILGWLMPPFLYIIAIIATFTSRNNKPPVWLIVVNTLFFIFQILYFLST